MSWNYYCVFVKSPIVTDTNKIFEKLNLGNYKFNKETSLHQANHAPEMLSVGFYNSCLIFVNLDMAFSFFEDKQSDIEKLFIDTFPMSEITSVVENSTARVFGYSVIENGQKIRMKSASYEQKYVDMGDLLLEEKIILEEPIFDATDIEDMKEDRFSDDEINRAITFEASWRVPNLLTKRYLGKTIGAINTSSIQLTMYER